MRNKIITLPEFSLVTLVGITGAGKTSFASRHFSPTQVLTSDRFRAMVSDNENCMGASGDAFEILYLVARKRLSRKLLTVVDATNVQDYARRRILELAHEFGASPVAIIFDIPPEVCVSRTLHRTDRPFGPDVVLEHYSEFQETMKVIQTEGFESIQVLGGVEEVQEAIVSITSETLVPMRDIATIPARSAVSFSP